MEKDQEQKSICKVCGKSFPSGMSLGGHMRSHLVKKSSKKPKVHSSKLAYVDDDDDDNEDDYVLTHYKKRSLKVLTDENSTAMHGNETRCKKMVKKPKVQSRKLAFVDDDDDNDDGYIFSEYSKRPLKVSTDENSTVVYDNATKCKECGKEFPSVRSLCGHMRWHTVKKTSEKDYVCKECGKGFDSIRAMFGHMTHHSRKSKVSNEPAYSQSDSEGKVAENFYSSSYDIDCDEIEQAAIILMMLSRGMIQTGSSSLVLRKSEEMGFLHSVDVLTKKKNKMNRRKKLGTWGSCSSFMFVKEKPGFDDLDDSFSSGDGKKVGVSDEVENEFSGFEIKNRKRTRVQPGENVKKHEGDKKTVGTKSKKLKKNERFACWICSKAFHTRKGLGGHKKAHKYDDFENNPQERITTNQEEDEKDNVFDLNFRVDSEEEANVDLELKPWSTKTDHKHESLLISNCVK